MLKPSPSRIFFALLGAFCVILVAAWFSGSTGKICNEGQPDHEQCTTYNLAPFILIEIRELLHSVENIITALATIAIAIFTWTLYRSSEKMWGLTRNSLALARAEFLSTHRPKIRIKHVWLLNEFWYDQPLNVRVVCVNHGTTDAQLIEYGLDFLSVRQGRVLPPDHQFAFRRTITTILKPGISAPFPDLVQSIDEDIEIAVRDGTADFYCVGYLHYMDGSGNVRTTAFCRRLILSKPLRSSGHFVTVENLDYEYED
jgi:hypothetical protein